MKRLLLSAIATCLTAAMLLAGCGTGEAPAGADEGAGAPASGETDSGGADQTVVPASGGDTVYFLHKGLDYYAWVAMQEQFRKYAQDTGVKFEILNAELDIATQVQQFQTALTQNPKAIIVTAVDSESLIECVKDANEMGIPVGVYDTPVTGGDIVITVDCDNVMAGRQAGELLVDTLIAKNGSATGKVLNVYGQQYSQVMRERKEGFDSVIRQYPDIEYIEVPGEGDRVKSQEATANAFAQHGYIDAVHGPSDYACYGIYEALVSTDNLKKVGEDGHVIFISLDGEPQMLDYIQEGYVDGSVNLDWHALGAICLELMEEYTFQGQPVPTSGSYSNPDMFTWDSTEYKVATDWNGPWLSLPTHKVTIENCNDPKSAGRYSADVLGIDYKA